MDWVVFVAASIIITGVFMIFSRLLMMHDTLKSIDEKLGIDLDLADELDCYKRGIGTKLDDIWDSLAGVEQMMTDDRQRRKEIEAGYMKHVCKDANDLALWIMDKTSYGFVIDDVSSVEMDHFMVTYHRPPEKEE